MALSSYTSPRPTSYSITRPPSQTSTAPGTPIPQASSPTPGTGFSILPVKPPLAAPTPGPAPAPAPPPSTPAPSPVQRYTDDFDVASGIARDILAGRETARIENPYQQQTDEYLRLLRDRLSGMDSTEMRAAKEEGLAGLDQQTAQSLERYASIAGSRGVQGGASASLMGRALAEGNRERASLERKLILDNLAAKDKAMQAYGGALQDATGTSLDVGKYNAGAADRDNGLMLSLPFDIMSGIGGYRAEDTARDAHNDELTIARDAIKNSAPPATEPVRNAVTSNDQVSIDNVQGLLNELGAKVGEKMKTGASSYLPGEDVNQAKSMIKQIVDLRMQDATQAEKDAEALKMLRDWAWNAGLIRPDGSPRFGGVRIG